MTHIERVQELARKGVSLDLSTGNVGMNNEQLKQTMQIVKDSGGKLIIGENTGMNLMEELAVIGGKNLIIKF